MMTLAKGIASGMPLGALVARAGIMDWEAGSHASTFGGNPVSCQAAMATIDLIENGLMENAARQGAKLMAGLSGFMSECEFLGDVRGKGLMVGVELVKDRVKKEPHRDLRNVIIRNAFQKGLLLLGCGENGIRFSPALTVTSEEIDTCLSIFRDVLQEMASK
jgi:4-aminobutyrate aminotransferase